MNCFKEFRRSNALKKLFKDDSPVRSIVEHPDPLVNKDKPMRNVINNNVLEIHKAPVGEDDNLFKSHNKLLMNEHANTLQNPANILVKYLF